MNDSKLSQSMTVVKVTVPQYTWAKFMLSAVLSHVKRLMTCLGVSLLGGLAFTSNDWTIHRWEISIVNISSEMFWQKKFFKLFRNVTTEDCVESFWLFLNLH